MLLHMSQKSLNIKCLGRGSVEGGAKRVQQQGKGTSDITIRTVTLCSMLPSFSRACSASLPLVFKSVVIESLVIDNDEFDFSLAVSAFSSKEAANMDLSSSFSFAS